MRIDGNEPAQPSVSDAVAHTVSDRLGHHDGDPTGPLGDRDGL
jgi:hypothetical protein